MDRTTIEKLELQKRKNSRLIRQETGYLYIKKIDAVCVRNFEKEKKRRHHGPCHRSGQQFLQEDSPADDHATNPGGTSLPDALRRSTHHSQVEGRLQMIYISIQINIHTANIEIIAQKVWMESVLQHVTFLVSARHLHLWTMLTGTQLWYVQIPPFLRLIQALPLHLGFKASSGLGNFTQQL